MEVVQPDAAAPAPVDAPEETINIFVEAIRDETRCLICFGVLKQTRLVKECLHRFCAPCIERSLRINKNECPACRLHLTSRRALQPDPAFDALVAALYGDVVAFEAAEEARIAVENAKNAAAWTGMSAALAAQRARTDAAYPDARRGPRAAKRPRWADDPYDDYAELEEDEDSEEEDRRRVVRRPAQNAANGNHPDDEGDLGPGKPWVRAPAAAKHRPVAAPAAPPPPPDPFPAATAMAKGLPGDPTVVHVFVCPSQDASPETILPALAAPYLCVPFNMTLQALDAALSAELGVPPGDGWGNGGLAFREGGAALPMWSQVGFLRQRCDARGEAFCLQYHLNTGNTAAPLMAAAAAPQAAPLSAVA